MRTLAAVPLVLLGVFGAQCAPPQLPTGACGKDTDCRGGLICRKGRCVDARKACRCASQRTVAGPRRATPARLRPMRRPWTRPVPPPMVITTPVPATPASMFRFDSLRRGRSAHTGPATRPRRTWRRRVGGAITGSPAVASDGTVYIGGQARVVMALSPAGRVRWRYRAGDRVWSSPALSPDGRTLYIGADDDHLHALDARSGRLRWKTRLGTCRPGATKNPEAVRCDVDSSPAIGADGTIYVGGDGLFALTPEGRIKWHFKTGKRVRSSPALYPNGTVVVGSQDNRVYAVDTKGVQKWVYPTGGDVDSSPAIGADGTVYIGSDDGRLIALRHDGVFRWAILTGGPVRGSPALGADGTVYVGSHDGRLYAVTPSGKVRWMVRTARRIQASPVVDAAGRIYVASQDRFLYAVAANGTVRWRFRFPNEVDSTAAVSATGRIHIGCDDGYLYTLK